jgi:formate hydrogenlyase transcriptional activator
MLSTGEMFWSDETFRIYGYDRSTQPAMERVFERVYPEDRALVQEHVDLAYREGKDCDVECRLLLPDDSVKHVRIVAHASKNEPGNIEFIGALTDLTDRKQAEALREGESRILEMIARDDALEHILEKLVRVVEAQFAGLLCSVLLLDEDGQHVRHGAAPSLPKPYTDAINGQRIGPKAGSCGTAMYRREPVVVSDILQDPLWEQYRHVAEPYGLRACWSTPIVAHSGKVLGSFAMYYREPRSPSPAETHALEVASHLAGIAIERKLAGDQLRRSEAYLAEAQRLSHTGSFGWRPDSGEIVWSDETYRIFEYDPTVRMTIDYIAQRVHPEDRNEFQKVVDRASAGATHFEHAYRLLLPGGRVKHIHALAHALQDASGNREFVGAGIDVTSIKRAEEDLRRSEMELQQMLDLAPQHVAVYGPNRERLYANRIALDYLGLSLEEWRRGKYIHPDDYGRLDHFFDHAAARGSADELELRVPKRDGTYRWFLARYNPLRDEQGQITRWYVTATDIEDRKQAEDRLRSENVALREEIDKASMFEEIVGTSPALKTVLSRISKVAPSDSTVLITGETGTGKELVARAIHRRSARASRPFVGVNCAAIPRDLIASELFGHEKGAFTGATQQRLGRFELANGGTIFLDEVGELPAETQIALLRVLQEHEFERVGGTRRIRADVRVIAATNRDLQAAISAGSFRSDLFYRLNVFPVEIPSLRERREDIQLLVEYFIDRYARKAGKKIKRVNKKTLELLQSYPWPGNIRELQNVIERSVILCETEIFSIDENWLPHPPVLTPESNQQAELPQRLLVQEKEMIEAALNDTQGRVSGPTGAAAKLGIPRSTLESKIRSLNINKNRYKT